MKYLHPDNKDKPYKDWRLPENRVQMCLRSYAWRMKHRDVDHYTYNEAYMTRGAMTDEQRIYFSMLFGITYQSSMAWVIWSHFPDIEKINWQYLEEWNNENYARQHFAKDTKYNKGKFIPILKDIHEKVLQKHGSLRAWINTFQDFDHALEEVMSIYRIGRMSGWLTTQAFYELCFDMRHIKPKSMLATDPSNWSVRSGLVYIYNKPELMDLDSKTKYSSDDIKWIERKEQEFIEGCNEHVSDFFNSPFTMETHLCQYKKMIKTGGDAPGTPTQDAYTRWYKLKEAWPELDWNFFEKVSEHAAPCVQKTFQNKILMKTGAETGQMINMHDDNDDLPNMYKEFGIEQSWLTDFDDYTRLEIKNNFNNYLTKMSGEKVGLEVYF